MGIAFFKVPRHKVFEYKPRYYDEEKERRDQRRRELGLDGPTEDSGSQPAGSLIRSGAMRARHDNFTRKMQQSKRRSQLFLIGLIVILSLITYLLAREFSEEIAEVVFKR